MKEIWKDVEGYEGYQVSNKGRVKSLNFRHTGKERILKSNPDGGYCLVSLYRNGKRTSKKIHRLVATAFIPNPENKPEVNHINHNKRDNRASNLEWVTSEENLTALFHSEKWQNYLESVKKH